MRPREEIEKNFEELYKHYSTPKRKVDKLFLEVLLDIRDHILKLYN